MQQFFAGTEAYIFDEWGKRWSSRFAGTDRASCRIVFPGGELFDVAEVQVTLTDMKPAKHARHRNREVSLDPKLSCVLHHIH